MTIKVHTLTAPSAWASYLINGGDPSQYDISEADKAAADAWVESVGLGPCVTCEEVGFLWHHDAFEFCMLGADCEAYTFYEHTEECEA